MTEPPPMTDTAQKRLAVLEKLKSVDDATKQEREAQLSLRRKLTKAREEARARSRRAADLDREWRCAQIAARRLELERAQKKLDDGRLSRARLVEAELKAGDAGDDDAREALERLVLGPSSALPTLPTLRGGAARDLDRLEAYDAIFDRGRAGEWASRGGVLELAARDAADDVADEAVREALYQVAGESAAARDASSKLVAHALLGGDDDDDDFDALVAAKRQLAARDAGGPKVPFGEFTAALDQNLKPARLAAPAPRLADQDGDIQVEQEALRRCWARGPGRRSARLEVPAGDVVSAVDARSRTAPPADGRRHERALRGRAPADVWPDVFPVAARVDDGGRAPGALDDDDAWARRDDAPRLWISTRGGPLARWQCVLPPPPPPPEKPKKGWFGSSKKKAAPAPPEPVPTDRGVLVGALRFHESPPSRHAYVGARLATVEPAGTLALWDPRPPADDLDWTATVAYSVPRERAGADPRTCAVAVAGGFLYLRVGSAVLVFGHGVGSPFSPVAVLDVGAAPIRGPGNAAAVAPDAVVAATPRGAVLVDVPAFAPPASHRGSPRAFAGAFFLDDGD
ncbi:hypothetical protein JL722_6074 [Aureococcus anophagefferens]|nr:hypothetical protein JL722_6074 [Aureococcus anophagefferens]